MQKAITFKKSEIDQQSLYSRASKEATRIHKDPSPAVHQYRTFDQILEKCLRGHYPELWLMSQGYVDDDRKYKDLYEPDGITPIDVKVTTCASNHRGVLQGMKNKIFAGIPVARRIYIFLNPLDSDEYEFYGIWNWNGKDWDGERPKLTENRDLQTAITRV